VRARDRAIGIVLGILLGLAVIVLFLFLGSRSTIDSPDISGNSTLEQTTTPTSPATPEPKPGAP
jgi:uncharacterized membrane protein required for colicin V production